MSDTPAPAAEPPRKAIPIWDVISEMALYASTALIITGLIPALDLEAEQFWLWRPGI